MDTTIVVTPELHRRAVEFLADRILGAAIECGKSAKEAKRAREHFKISPNDAHDVMDVSAGMGVDLARALQAGEVQVQPVNRNPQHEDFPDGLLVDSRVAKRLQQERDELLAACGWLAGVVIRDQNGTPDPNGWIQRGKEYYFDALSKAEKLEDYVAVISQTNSQLAETLSSTYDRVRELEVQNGELAGRLSTAEGRMQEQGKALNRLAKALAPITYRGDVNAGQPLADVVVDLAIEKINSSIPRPERLERMTESVRSVMAESLP